MRKTISILVGLMLTLSLGAGVSAGSEEKGAEVTVTTSKLVVDIGEAVSLSAFAEKHGSAYVDKWSAVKAPTEGEPEPDEEQSAMDTPSIDTTAVIEGGITTLDTETGMYASAAVFTADKPGTYIIRYVIRMHAGKSGTVFFGASSVTIEVSGTPEITGADIRDLVVKPVLGTDGTIKYYTATGNVYTLWNDGKAVLYGSIRFYLNAGQTSKDVNVNIFHEGKSYAFLVHIEYDRIE